MNVSPEEIKKMEGRLYQHDSSFDAPAGQDDEESLSPADYSTLGEVEDPQNIVVNQDERNKLHLRMERLFRDIDDRSVDIFKSRWLTGDGDKSSLKELGERYGVSPERIRQLEVRVFKKVKRDLLWA